MTTTFKFLMAAEEFHQLYNSYSELILTDSPAANPWCEVWGGVSTADGSTAAMEDCSNSTQGQACTGMLVNWTTAEVSDAYDYFVAIL